MTKGRQPTGNGVRTLRNIERRPNRAGLRVVVACLTGVTRSVAPSTAVGCTLPTSGAPSSSSARPSFPASTTTTSSHTRNSSHPLQSTQSTCGPSSRMSTPSVGGAHSPMCMIHAHQSLNKPEKRKAEAERIRQKYPDRIPVRPLSFVSHISHSMLVRTLLRTTQSAGHLREGGQDGYPDD